MTTPSYRTDRRRRRSADAPRAVADAPRDCTAYTHPTLSCSLHELDAQVDMHNAHTMPRARAVSTNARGLGGSKSEST
jgi:hypothetical protein